MTTILTKETLTIRLRAHLQSIALMAVQCQQMQANDGQMEEHLDGMERDLHIAQSIQRKLSFWSE